MSMQEDDQRLARDKEQVRLILQHVMHCTVLNATTKSYDIPELPKDIVWPIAFWNGDVDQWMIMCEGANYPSLFNPLQDLNDAWLIVEELSYPRTMPFEGELSAKTYFQCWLVKPDLWQYTRIKTCHIICDVAIMTIDEKEA